MLYSRQKRIGAWCTIVLLATGVHSSLGAAQSAVTDHNDVKLIQDCLNATTNKPGTECIGKVSDLCAPHPEKMSVEAQSACFAREYQAWNSVLNDTYKHLSTQVDAGAKSRLAQIQSSWIRTRQQTCSFFAEAHAGDLSGMRQNICYADSTRQCIEI